METHVYGDCNRKNSPQKANNGLRWQCFGDLLVNVWPLSGELSGVQISHVSSVLGITGKEKGRKTTGKPNPPPPPPHRPKQKVIGGHRLGGCSGRCLDPEMVGEGVGKSAGERRSTHMSTLSSTLNFPSTLLSTLLGPAVFWSFRPAIPQSEVLAKFVQETGEKCGEHLAKIFAHFGPSFSRENGRRKFHEKSSTFPQCTKLSSFTAATLGGADSHFLDFPVSLFCSRPSLCRNAPCSSFLQSGCCDAFFAICVDFCRDFVVDCRVFP